jgi:tRNA G18 (ribose-2'-O)-methylase SpoU
LQPIYISKRNSTYQILHALKTNRTKRKRLQEVFVEGIAAIKSSVQAGKTLKRLIYRDGGRLSNWANNIVASNRDAQLIAIDEKLFNELCDKNNPAELLATIANEEIKFNQIKLQDNPFITVIDRPSNHGNLGSIIRSAHAFGVDLLVTVGHAVDMYDPAVIRASMGSIFLT